MIQKRLLNLNFSQSIRLLALLLLPFTILESAAGNTYYAQLTASASPTGAGLVYVNTEKSKGESSSAKQSTSTSGEEKTFYLYADVNYGYAWSTWVNGTSSGTLTNATTRNGAKYEGKASTSDNGTNSYTVTGSFTRRKIENAGVSSADITVTQTWKSHSRQATVTFEDKYALTADSKPTLTYSETTIPYSKQTEEWKQGQGNDEGVATTNGKYNIALAVDFSNPEKLKNGALGSITITETAKLSSPSSSINQAATVSMGTLDLTPVFSTDKTSYTFSATEVNTTASTTIKAEDYGDLPVSNSKCAWSYALSGTNANQFECSQSTNVLTVTYKPTAEGSHTSTLTITAKWTDAAGTELKYTADPITLKGTATKPDFSISNLDFETTTVAGATTETLTLLNPQYINSATISFSGTNAGCFSATTYNASTKSFDITFTPTQSGGKYQAGTYTATATVKGTATASSVEKTITLTAVVKPAPLADFTVPSALTFNNGEDMAAGTTDDQTLTLTNLQNIVGNPTISITGTNASMYSVQGSYNATAHTFVIRFSASGSKGGRFTADATITATNYDGIAVTKTVTLNAFMPEVVDFDVRVTKANGDLVKEIDWATAIKSYQAAGYTFTLMRNIDLGTITATNNITKAITIDLNGKTLRAFVNTKEIGILNVNAAVAVTIKDSRTTGQIINEGALNAQMRTITVTKGSLTLESGTLAVNNTMQYRYGTSSATDGIANVVSMATRTIHQAAGTTVNIKGGKIYSKASRNGYGIVQASSASTQKAGTTVLNMSGGEIYSECSNRAYGVSASGLFNLSGGTITTRLNTETVNANTTYVEKNPTNATYSLHNYSYTIQMNGGANVTATSNYYGVLNMTGGEVYAYNDNCDTNASGAVQDDRIHGIYFNAGAVNVKTGTASDGTYSQKWAATGEISGGSIYLENAGPNAYAVWVAGSYNSFDDKECITKIKNTTITVKAYQGTYGVYANASIGTTVDNKTPNMGACFQGAVELTDVTINSTTTTAGTAYCAYANAAINYIFKDQEWSTAQSNGYPRIYDGEYGAAAKITINSGTYTAFSAAGTAYAIGSNTRQRTIWNSTSTTAANRELGGNVEVFPTLILHGGTFKGETTQNTSGAVLSGGNTTIDGGTYEAYSNGTTSRGIYATAGTLKVSNVKITSSATNTAYGIDLGVGISDYTGFSYAAQAELNNLDVTALTRSGNEADGILMEVTKKPISTAGTGNYVNMTQIGEYAIGSKCVVNGGTYTVTSEGTTAYGIRLNSAAICDDVNGDGQLAIGAGELMVKNATFVVETKGGKTAYGVWAGGPTTIDKSKFTVSTSAEEAWGVRARYGKTTISNSTIDVTAGTATARGVYIDALMSSISTNNNTTHFCGVQGYEISGEVELNDGNTFTVKTSSGNTAYGIQVVSATGTATQTVEAKGLAFAGSHAVASKAVINGGKYTATASGTTAYAIYLGNKATLNEVSASPTCIVNGGKFKGTATSTFADVNKPTVPKENFVLNGGYYVLNTNLSDWVAESKTVNQLTEGPEYTEGYRYQIGGETAGVVCKVYSGSTLKASFNTLEEALQYVNQNSTQTLTIVMVADYILPSGDYVLPAKATLLVPYSASQTAAKKTSLERATTTDTPSIFRTLTFASGVNLTSKGIIEVGGRQYGGGNVANGSRPYGTHGFLYLKEGVTITLESGSQIYAWGYVSGKGEIIARGGAKCYEMMQLNWYKGGNTTSEANSQKSNYKIFPITDYAYQNIECPITYYAGALGYGYAAVVASSWTGLSSVNDIELVGTSTTSFFRMTAGETGEDIWVRKEYDPKTDYTNWIMNSGARITGINLNIGVSISSSDFYLPITSNFAITMNYGDVYVDNDVVFLPGSKLIINKEAKGILKSGKLLLFYDSESWMQGLGSTSVTASGWSKAKTCGSYYYPVTYSPSWKEATGSTANPRLGLYAQTQAKINSGVPPIPDAELFVHGKLEINGTLYTIGENSEGKGGNIHSTNEDAGKIIFSTAAPTATKSVYKICFAIGASDSNNNWSDMIYGGTTTARPALLLNGDGSFSNTSGTAKNKTWVYYDDKWQCWTQDGCFTLDAQNNPYGHPSEYIQLTSKTEDANHLYHDAATGQRAFLISGDCEWWEVEPTPYDGNKYKCVKPDHNGNYKYYVYKSGWEVATVTIYWKNYDNSKIVTYDNALYGNIPKYLDAAPTKPATTTEYFTWTGWLYSVNGQFYPRTEQLPEVTADEVTFTAFYDTKKYQSTVTFKNPNGSVIYSGLFDRGAVPECPADKLETNRQKPTTTKAYEFKKCWNTNATNAANGTCQYGSEALPAVGTSAATYYAVYEETPRPYTVTFFNYNAVDVLQESEVGYGISPVYSGVTPFRSNTSAYSYKFTGWKQQGGTIVYEPTATLPTITGEVAYIAQFEQTELQYQVFFKRPDGTVISAPFYKYNQTPTFPDASLVMMESTVDKVYTFSGNWSPAVCAPVTEDGMTYEAIFNETTRQYTVTFKNYDASVLQTYQMDYDDTPTYTGTPATPLKPNDSRYSYEFSGWSDGTTTYATGETLPLIKGDITFTAQYTQEPLKFNIIYRREDGYIIKHDKLNYGGTTTPPSASECYYEDDDYAYTFSAWSPATIVNPVEKDATYTAQYTKASKETGDLLDIVDWTSDGSIVLNMNGYSSALSSNKTGWTIEVSGATKESYNKDDREKDRTLIIDGLTLTPNNQITITAKDANGTIESKHNYTVPFIIEGESSISSISSIFVRSGRLTIDQDLTVKQIIVNAGAELVIGSGKTLTIAENGELRLRTTAWKSAVLTDNGIINFEGTGESKAKMYYSRQVAEKSVAYQIGFPFEVDLNNTKLSNGTDAKFGTYYGIMRYDADSRANNGKDFNNWVALNPRTEHTLNANQGYQIMSASAYYYEILFPVTYTQTTGDKTLTLQAHQGNSGNSIDQGWNYLVSPYTQTYACEYSNTNPEEALKLNTLHTDNQTFSQDVLTEIQPASPFYYQASGNGTLSFGSIFTATAAPMLRTLQSEIPTQWIRLEYMAENAQADYTNIYLHPDKFTMDYELEYDVVKLSKSGGYPFIYTTLPCGDLAFAALPDSAATVGIPLTVYTPAMQTMTFSLTDDRYLARVEHLYIIDLTEDHQTDLLQSDYSTEVSQGTTANRFLLQAVMREQMEEVTTSTDEVRRPWRVTVINREICVFDAAEGAIRLYDATGRLVSISDNNERDIRFTVPAAGVYMLQQGSETQRVIVR